MRIFAPSPTQSDEFSFTKVQDVVTSTWPETNCRFPGALKLQGGALVASTRLLGSGCNIEIPSKHVVRVIAGFYSGETRVVIAIDRSTVFPIVSTRVVRVGTPR